MTPLEALDRARQAWERSQPQLFIELWPDGLEEPPCGGTGGSSSPPTPLPAAPTPYSGLGGGLTAGVGPAARHDLTGVGLCFAPVRLSPEGRDDRRQ